MAGPGLICSKCYEDSSFGEFVSFKGDRKDFLCTRCRNETVLDIKSSRDIKLELDGLSKSYLSGHVMDEDLEAAVTKRWVSAESLIAHLKDEIKAGNLLLNFKEDYTVDEYIQDFWLTK